MKTVSVFIGSRAHYSSIKSVLAAIKQHPELNLHIVAGSSAILDKYGRVVDLIRSDGFYVNNEVNMLIEGGCPSNMARTVALGIIQLSTIYDSISPDIVLVVGDRYEIMAPVLCASYMNIVLAHTMGGEVSGTIDESIRHAVTKFAHLHFPASPDACQRILRLGENPQHVFAFGCPRIDLVKEIIHSKTRFTSDSLFGYGVGSHLNLQDPFLLVSQHPVTTECEQALEQMNATLEATFRTGLQVIVLWPNSDAGSDYVSKSIRNFRETQDTGKYHFFKNLSIEIYVSLMHQTSCLIGNSSSGIREGAFIGTPVVNVGSRQSNRQAGENVLTVDHDPEAIYSAINTQLQHGRYPSNPLYGDGTAGLQIANALANISIPTPQKLINY